jgi:hypothetical protein
MAMFSVYEFFSVGNGLKLFSFFPFSLISYSLSYFPTLLLFMAK